jgi:hypothetical protein
MTLKTKPSTIDALVFPFLFMFGYLYYPVKDNNWRISLFDRFLPIDSFGEGMTRSIASFTHFRFGESFSYHWFGGIFMLFMLSVSVRGVIRHIRTKTGSQGL